MGFLKKNYFFSKRVQSGLLLIFAICTYLFSHPLTAQDNPISGEISSENDITSTEAKPWPSDFSFRLRQSIRNGAEDIRLDLSASIFNGLLDQSLFSWNDEQHAIRIGVKREVYDNSDVAESYTVIDHLSIPYHFNFFNLPNLNLPMVAIKANFYTQIALEAINIRQVYPRDLARLPRPETVEKDFKEAQADLSAALSLGHLEQQKVPSNNDDESDDEDGVNDRILMDYDKLENRSFGQKLKDFFTGNSVRSLAKARWSSLFNILSHPFKIPVTKRNFEKMEIGEIHSYLLSGLIGFDTSAAFSISAVPGVDSHSVGIGSTSYVKGQFRIGLLKENDHTILLKLTKVTTLGNNISLGAEQQLVIFDGFTVLDSNVAKITESVIPFQLSLNKSDSKIFDFAYRFDLSNPKSLEAYGDALLGNLSLAQKLAKQTDSGVSFAFKRDSRDHLLAREYRLKLSFLFERIHQSGKRTTNMVITDGQGTHHMFRSDAFANKSWAVFWGDGETRSTRFRFMADQEENIASSDKGLGLELSANIIDQRMSFKELQRYVREMQEATGEVRLLPDITIEYPRQLCMQKNILKELDEKNKICQKVKATNLGSGHFFYRLGLSKKAILKFMRIPESEHWSRLEEAFEISKGKWSTPGKRALYRLKELPLNALNIPLALVGAQIRDASKIYHAYRFAKHWAELKTKKKLEDLSQSMALMLRSNLFHREYWRVLKKASEGIPFEYYIDARSDKTFGRVIKQGEGAVLNDQTFENRLRQVEFENPASRDIVDRKAVIEGLEAKLEKNGDLTLNFNLAHDPRYLYVLLEQQKLMLGIKKLAGALWTNNTTLTRFKAGFNTITLKKEDARDSFQIFMKYLKKPGHYNLKLAYLRPGSSWGPLSSVKITIPKPADPK